MASQNDLCEQLDDVHVLQCREIWGGIEPADQQISVPGFEGWVFSRPYQDSHLGGDIHYISLCGQGMITRLMVADVSGHGGGVADVAKTLHRLLKKHINTPDQTQLVRDLNSEFAELASEDCFATAVVATYFAIDRSLVICNAGHPRPLYYHAAANSWHLLQEDIPQATDEIRDLPLGIVNGTGYTQFAVTLEKGDFVLIYTDFLIEARNKSGVSIGQAGLLDRAGSLEITKPDQLGHKLLVSLADYTGAQTFDDDVTLLVLGHNGIELQTANNDH